MTTKDTISKIINLIPSDVKDYLKDSLSDAFQDTKYVFHLNRCICEVKELHPDLFTEIPITGISVPLDVLDPSQSSEEMQEKIAPFLMQSLVADDEEIKNTIIRNVCESYLAAVQGEVQSFHLLKRILQLEKSQAAYFLQILDTAEKNSRLLANILEKNLQQDMENRPRSSVEFCEKFQKFLFWDEDVKLSDVYVVPEIYGRDGTMLDCIEQMLQGKNGGYLIIEGLPGVGKTSLLYRLANQYTDAHHYFLKLSALDFEGGDSLQMALNRMKEEDPLWVNYTKSGSVLFLDGYDEISGVIAPKKFMDHIRRLVDKGLKVIVTTRPNYLSNEERNTCILHPYNKEQMSQWVMAYYSKSGRDAEEAIETLQRLKEKIMDWKMMEVLQIPIFLYIVVNKQVDLSQIDSCTELYENVFQQMLENKIKRETYHQAQEIAERLGHFLEVHSETVFQKKHYEAFCRFIAEIVGVDWNKNLEAVLGNSFIRMISEGTEYLEFYHKTIQDYFSAKYIYHQLKGFVKKYETIADENTEEMEYAGVEYAALLGIHSMKEEETHLKYFIEQDRDFPRETWGKAFRSMFLSAIYHGINPYTENWVVNRFKQKDSQVRFSLLQERCRYLFQNHAQLMKNILKIKPITNDAWDDYRMQSALHMALVDPLDGGLAGVWEKSNLLCAYLYGLVLEGLQLDVVLYNSSVKGIFGKDVTVERLTISDFDYCGEYGEQRRINLYYCNGEKCEVRNMQLYESVLRCCTVNHLSTENIKVMYGQILESIFHESKITGNFVNTTFYLTQFENCQFGTGIGRSRMRLEDCIFEQCIFKGVTFQNIYVKNVTFVECRFEHCTFAKAFKEHIVMEECEIDEI